MKWILFIYLLSLLSCTSSNERAAWRVAEQSVTNRKELVYFLEYYKKGNDRERYKAACFLIENMPNKYSISEDGRNMIYDVDVVKADSLIKSLEYSFDLKKHSPFLKDYTFEQFCEYVLPYRIANEPLQFYWKWDCVKRFGNGSSEDIIMAARNINAMIKVGISPEFYRDPQKSYSTLMQAGYGKCDDRATLLVMALRSVGIPAAFEFVPYWGSSNNGHSFCSLILSDGRVIPFQNSIDSERNAILYRKVPKIYRKVYSIMGSYDCNHELSNPFLFFDILDVTEKHSVDSRKVQLRSELNESLIYLSVFAPFKWVPVAVSNSRNFYHVGTGTNCDSIERVDEAVSLGKGILYLPSRLSADTILAISEPIIVSNDSIRILDIDTLCKGQITLERKFPLNKRIVHFARNMLRGVFEGANKADFSDAQELYEIVETPFSRMQKILIDDNRTYRYIRYRRPQGTFSIAELRLSDVAGNPLAFEPIACEAILKGDALAKVFDSNLLTYFEVNGGMDLWVGVDLKESRKITSIEFAPRNDDNAISPDDLYELYYWNRGWIYVGSKIADGYSISFDNVPLNALFWLRDITKGREERPFTYEDGHQVWW